MNEKPHPRGFRQKNLLRPNRIKIAGIHSVTKLENDTKKNLKLIDTDDVRVLHMRSMPSKENCFSQIIMK